MTMMMSVPANSRLITGARRPTAFKAGVSGNPLGRTPGTRNKATVEAREFAQRLVDDEEYRRSLRERLLAGSAGQMEILLWAYAHGKPPDRIETGGPGAFAELSTGELKARLEAALRSCLE